MKLACQEGSFAPLKKWCVGVSCAVKMTVTLHIDLVDVVVTLATLATFMYICTYMVITITPGQIG